MACCGGKRLRSKTGDTDRRGGGYVFHGDVAEDRVVAGYSVRITIGNPESVGIAQRDGGFRGSKLAGTTGHSGAAPESRAADALAEMVTRTAVGVAISAEGGDYIDACIRGLL